MDTPPKFNIAPEKKVVGRLLSYWEDDFSMLNFGRVPKMMGLGKGNSLQKCSNFWYLCQVSGVCIQGGTHP